LSQFLREASFPFLKSSEKMHYCLVNLYSESLNLPIRFEEIKSDYFWRRKIVGSVLFGVIEYDRLTRIHLLS
jgi:methyltransferase-like protein